MAMMRGTTRGTSSFTNSICAMSGSNDVVLPMPAPKNTTLVSNNGILSPAASIECDTTAIHASRHQPADQSTSGNGCRCGSAGCDARDLCAKCRYQQREEMRDQADLRKQAKCMPDASVMNWKSRHSCLPRSGRADAEVTERPAAPRA